MRFNSYGMGVLLALALIVGCESPGPEPAAAGSSQLTSTDSPVTVDQVRRNLESGAISASAALLDPRYSPIREQREFRLALLENQVPGELDIVVDDEPGTRLTVSGTVRDGDGRPIADVSIYVYQTDARGWYGIQSSEDDDRARIFGIIRTGADGRYQFRTVRPGPYAHSPTTAAHIHYMYRAEGYERGRGVGPPSLFFEDDPLLTDADRREVVDDGGIIAVVKIHADGSQSCTYDILMRRTTD